MVWHVDDLMASFEDNFELMKLSCYLGIIYGAKLSMHMGSKCDNLGVDMEFCKDGALEVSMFKYLNDVVEEFPKIIKGKVATRCTISCLRSETMKTQRSSAKNSIGVSPHGGTVALHGNEGQARHPNGSGVPHNKVKEPR